MHGSDRAKASAHLPREKELEALLKNMSGKVGINHIKFYAETDLWYRTRVRTVCPVTVGQHRCRCWVFIDTLPTVQ